jgi:flagellar biosynthetic protein FlhB
MLRAKGRWVMAEPQDKDSKTEEPTEKKLRDALDRGNAPVSREASIFASLAGMLILAAFVARESMREASVALGGLLEQLDGWPLEVGGDATALMARIATEVLTVLIPVFVILIAAGLAAAFMQNAPRIVLDRVKPDLQRISLGNGWRRIVGARGRAEFLKSIFKLMSIGLVLFLVLETQLSNLVNAMAVDADALPEFILMVALRLLAAVSIATLLLLAADIVLTRVHWRKDLRMSRQELRDEMRQIEGDPLMKARLRSLALDRVRKNMIAAVQRATLVIANPTHYAVALRYVREEGGAPIVLAKGKDLVALRIREMAEQHDIPVIEDKPLARSLYDSVEVDRPIPREFYKALAEIIHMLYVRTRRAT